MKPPWYLHHISEGHISADISADISYGISMISPWYLLWHLHGISYGISEQEMLLPTHSLAEGLYLSSMAVDTG